MEALNWDRSVLERALQWAAAVEQVPSRAERRGRQPHDAAPGHLQAVNSMPAAQVEPFEQR